MQAVKARKQGNAMVVTLPSALKVPEGKEFYVFMGEDGRISFIPKIANIYDEAAKANCSLWEPEEWDDVQPAGREVI